VVGNLPGLGGFLEELVRLENGERQTLRIVHIGDSHIQADIMTGAVRRCLQQQFGCAGRGVVFPYNTAGTNGPDDYAFSTNCTWTAKRCVFPDQPMPVGLSGIGLQTFYADFLLRLNFKGVLDCGFDRIVVSAPKGPEMFDLELYAEGAIPPTYPVFTTRDTLLQYEVKAGETLYAIAGRFGLKVEDLMRQNDLSDSRLRQGQVLQVSYTVSGEQSLLDSWRQAVAGSVSLPNTDPEQGYTHTVTLARPVHHFSLKGRKNSERQRTSLIHGFVLENTEQRGIIYSSIGVNGAMFEHYNKAEHFYAQLAALQPDLIIVSLGTNESAGGGRLDKHYLKAQMAQMLGSLRGVAPQAGVLLFTNPDIARSGGRLNSNIPIAREAILEVASEHGTAFWDWQEVMGGTGSMAAWVANGLARTDRVHFSRSGYELLGNMFCEALTKALQQHKQR
jgi:lysophospholipase L1-like esterase